ncbi:P-loop containing nucleoside triphosphate hydrolase protein, partial [Caulochytrium protostelioides]
MAALSRHPRFSTPMKANAKTFGIVHFGGPVHYDTDGFTAKNTDILSPDFVSIFRGNGNDIRPSDNPFARALFSEKIISTQKDPRAGGIVAAAQTNKRPVRQPSMSLQRRQSMKRRVGEKPTVAYNFAHAVTEMCETLQETVAWYVVCLKPNERLRDTQFDVAFVAQQLTAYAVPTLVDTLRVTGDYAMSTLIGDFAQAYAPLLSGEGAVATVRTADPAAKQVQDLVAYFHLTQAATDDPAAPAPMVAMGANKIFLREPAWQLLD